MKRTALACTPWRNNMYNIAAGILALGVLLSLIASAKSLAITFWKIDSVAAVNRLLGYVILLAAAAMFFFREKYRFRFAAFALLIGCLSVTRSAFVALAALCLLLSSVGFVGNRAIFKKLPTPWICLLGALFVLLELLSGDIFGSKLKFTTVAYLITLAGIFLLLFFTQPQRRAALADFTVLRATRRARNPAFFAAAMFMLADLLFSIFLKLKSDLGFSLASNPIQFLLPIVLYIVCIFLLCSRKPAKRFGLALFFLFLIYQSDFYPGSYPLLLFVLLFVSAYGFKGNDNLLHSEEHHLTVIDIVALSALLLCLVGNIHDLVSTIRALLDTQPHKLTAAYRKQAVLTVLPAFAHILRSAALMLLVACTKLEQTETSFIAAVRAFFGKMAAYCRNFQKNCGSKIQKYAYILSTINIVLMFVCLCAAALSFALGVGAGVSDVIAAYIPFKVIAACPFALGGAVTFFFSALATWFIYAYGQIAQDIHTKGFSRAGCSYTKVDATETDNDLPDF